MIKSKPIPFYDFFLLREKVEEDIFTGCWNWTGSICSKGYGSLKIKGHPYNFRAHRVSYSVFRGEIDQGNVIDHMCKNKKCINPWHLRSVSQLRNTLNSKGNPTIENMNKTHCKHGHEFTLENTRIRRGKTARECLACVRRIRKDYKKRRRENENKIIKKDSNDST